MKSVVYFAASNGLIKVGTTIDLPRRIDSLKSQSAAAVIVIGSVEGDIRHERATHDKLGAYRRHGEWFVDCAPVRQTIRTVLDHGFEAAGIAVAAQDETATTTVAEAEKLSDLIVRHSMLTAREAEDRYGLPINSIWSLRYRRPKSVNADVYFALVRAARSAVRDAQARLSDDAEFVEALSALRVERLANLEEIEAGIAGLKARLRNAASETAGPHQG